MKILLLTSFFPPLHTAGTERRTLAYALGLQRLGHKIQVVCVGKWDEGRQYWNGYTDEVYQQIPVRRVHMNWTLAPDSNQYLYYNPVVEKHLSLWLEEWQPEIAHITSCLTLSASIIQSVKDHNIPLVLTLTDFWFSCPRVNLLKGDGSLCDGNTTAWECLQCKLLDSGIYRRVNSIIPEVLSEKIFMKVSRNPRLTRLHGLRGMALDMEQRKSYLSAMLQSADCVTAPSFALRDIIRLSQPSVNVRVVYSGHDLSWMSQMPTKKPSRVLRIAYIGQVTHEKGVHILISAFCSSGISNRAELMIFGDHNKDAKYVGGLVKIISEHNAPVKFKGSFSHEMTGEILSDVDVVVVPSLWHENNPRVIQESFAVKIPVVASNVSGISEFVQHEVDGLLFERGDVNDLVVQLKRLVDNPALLEKLKGGIQNIRSVGEEILELEEIYQKLLLDRINL